MSTFKELWWKRNIEKLGSEEAVRDFYSKSGASVDPKNRGKGGFKNNPALAREAGKRGGLARGGKTKKRD